MEAPPSDAPVHPSIRVILSGFNLDSRVIDEARAKGVPDDHLTPEVLSAAYARISRDPAPVDELRRVALSDVARARSQNERIVFGLGHASVAEHAVFNFDIIGPSRLAIEALEQFRLCSYTEKSQRYIRLDQDLVSPEEVRRAGLEPEFRHLGRRSHAIYEALLDGLRRSLSDEDPGWAKTPEGRRAIEGRAREDARYATTLSVSGQLGLTANARNLEHLCRRLGSHPLAEVRAIADRLRDEGRRIAPSLIRYAEPTPEETPTPPRLAHLAGSLVPKAPRAPLEATAPSPPVRLVQVTPEGDRVVAAALLHGAGSVSLEHCLRLTRTLPSEALRQIFLAAFSGLSMHQAPPRALELARLTVEATVSAACFGQLKRHRMATLLPQVYQPSLGITCPPSVQHAGLAPLLAEAAELAEALHARLTEACPEAAAYALLQAHRRRVLVEINARELWHICRLRQDKHAQWDIRELADSLVRAAREHLPLTLMLACGKDCFEAVRREAIDAAWVDSTGLEKGRTG